MKFTTIITLLHVMAAPMAMASAISMPKASDMDKGQASGLSARQGAPCALHAHYQSDWQDGGLRRYAVVATAEGVAAKAGWYVDGKMLDEWCHALDGTYIHTHTYKKNWLWYPEN